MFHAAQSQLAAYPGRCAGRFCAAVLLRDGGHRVARNLLLHHRVGNALVALKAALQRHALPVGQRYGKASLCVRPGNAVLPICHCSGALIAHCAGVGRARFVLQLHGIPEGKGLIGPAARHRVGKGDAAQRFILCFQGDGGRKIVVVCAGSFHGKLGNFPAGALRHAAHVDDKHIVQHAPAFHIAVFIFQLGRVFHRAQVIVCRQCLMQLCQIERIGFGQLVRHRQLAVLRHGIQLGNVYRQARGRRGQDIVACLIARKLPGCDGHGFSLPRRGVCHGAFGFQVQFIAVYGAMLGPKRMRFTQNAVV